MKGLEQQRCDEALDDGRDQNERDDDEQPAFEAVQDEGGKRLPLFMGFIKNSREWVK